MLFHQIAEEKLTCQVDQFHHCFETIAIKPAALNKLVSGSENNLDDLNNATCFRCSLGNYLDKEGLALENEPFEKKAKLDIGVRDGYKSMPERSNPQYRKDDDIQVLQHCQTCEVNAVSKQLGINQVLFILESWFGLCAKFHIIRRNFRKLVPKNLEKFSSTYDLVVYDLGPNQLSLVVIPLTTSENNVHLSNRSYAFQFNDTDQILRMYINDEFGKDFPPKALVASKDWLLASVLPRLKKWSQSTQLKPNQVIKKSPNTLVNMERYSELYVRLKKKYGPHFVSIWPENTDPLKFVYEDVAIATYLLLIWEDERKEKNLKIKQSFIDLGCGNGLLVHILSGEGHTGKGVDITRRKIWDLYDSTTILEEFTIIPHKLKVDVDWIIGNHTDELTPWIPVIAARSSYQTNYFVLPCCFYDFTKKFDCGIGTTVSRYRTYLDFIVKIGEDCGFCVEEDTLKIPSTKRICSLGRKRTYNIGEYIDIDNKLQLVCSVDFDSDDNSFTPREVDNDPKNCTQIDPHVKEKMVDILIKHLLEKKYFLSHVFYGKREQGKADGEGMICKEVNTTSNVFVTDLDSGQDFVNWSNQLTSSGHKWTEWNAGDCLSLSDCVNLFNPELLKELKQQSGGLKSFLLNNQRIFKVGDGKVALRDFRNACERRWGRKSTKSEATRMFKTTSCWFYTCHPQGCVLKSTECTYLHGAGDIQMHLDNL